MVKPGPRSRMTPGISVDTNPFTRFRSITSGSATSTNHPKGTGEGTLDSHALFCPVLARGDSGRLIVGTSDRVIQEKSGSVPRRGRRAYGLRVCYALNELRIAAQILRRWRGHRQRGGWGVVPSLGAKITTNCSGALRRQSYWHAEPILVPSLVGAFKQYCSTHQAWNPRDKVFYQMQWGTGRAAAPSAQSSSQQ